LVFYNAFLPEIVPKEKQDYASALGFTFGYVGSVLLMVFNLSMIMFPDWYGIEDPTLPPRISFLSVGIWWLVFSLIPFAVLPDNIYDKPTPFKRSVLFHGYKRLFRVLKEIRYKPYLRRFLYAFFLYSFAAQTIFYVAGIFGSKELGLPASKLILTILLVQLVGIAGAMGFAKVSEKIGNIKALLIILSIWASITVMAYFLNKSDPGVEYRFYFLGAMVGLVMGSIQTLSRSTYSKMLPKDPGVHTTYFSFFDVFEKIAIVLGTFAFGYLEWITGSMKAAILMMMTFFITAAIILYPLSGVWKKIQESHMEN
jgi:UMF1 family MFS transporter